MDKVQLPRQSSMTGAPLTLKGQSIAKDGLRSILWDNRVSVGFQAIPKL